MGKLLAAALRKTFDDGADKEAAAREAGIEVSTLNQILSTVINCPPIERLRGFARSIDGVTFEELQSLWEQDGCSPEPVSEGSAIEIRQSSQGVLIAEADSDENQGPKRLKIKTGIRAETLTDGNRMYSTDALRGFVEEGKAFIRMNGPSHMQNAHIYNEGRTGFQVPPEKTVAMLYDVDFIEADGSIQLSEIRWVDTVAGRDFQAIAEAGGYISTSLRGVGKGELRRIDGKTVFYVTKLGWRGFDLFPKGVENFKDQGNRLVTEANMSNEKVLTADETRAAISAETAPILEKIGAFGNTLTAINEQLGALAVKPAKPVVEAEGEDGTEGEDAAKAAEERYAAIESRLSEREAVDARNEVERKKVLLVEAAESIAGELIQDEKYKALTKEMKALIVGRDWTPIGEAELALDDLDGIKAKIQPLIDAEIEHMGRVTAAAKLQQTGFIEGQGQTPGVQHVAHVVSESTPNMENIAKLRGAAIEEIRRYDPETFILDEKAPEMHLLQQHLSNFDREHYQELVAEAAGNQLDVGFHSRSMQRTIIELTQRRLTALPICTVVNMPNTTLEIGIAKPNTAESSDLFDDVVSYMVGESGTITLHGVTNSKFNLYANRLPLNTSLTPEEIQVSRNTPFNAQAQAISNLSLKMASVIDRIIWEFTKTSAQQVSFTERTTFQSLTNVSSTNEWTSPDRGWMRYEILRKADSNGNPVIPIIARLYSTSTERNLQGIEVQEPSGPTALTYGTDYNINFGTGSVVLTAAGVAIEAGNGLEAKYTFANNTEYWSTITPDGITGAEHISNLRQTINRAGVRVSQPPNNYRANTFGWPLDLEAWATSADLFSMAGGRSSDVLTGEDEIPRFTGKNAIATPSLQLASGADWDGVIPVFQRGACYYGINAALTMNGPEINTTTGEQTWLGETWFATDVPVPEMLALVHIEHYNRT